MYLCMYMKVARYSFSWSIYLPSLTINYVATNNAFGKIATTVVLLR